MVLLSVYCEPDFDDVDEYLEVGDSIGIFIAAISGSETSEIKQLETRSTLAMARGYAARVHIFGTRADWPG